MKIAIGADHAGYEMKKHIKDFLESKGHEIIDKGTNGTESVDYPDFGHGVCKEVEVGNVVFGILLCGTANGMAMTANKHEGIRCGLCWTEEIARLTKQHNNANVIALPARFIDNANAEGIVEAYMQAEFEGGRHQGRIDKIGCM